MKKKILLVCDNRDTRNWGSRGTSIALGQILGFRGEITSTPHELAIKRHPVGPLRSYISSGRHGRTISRLIRKTRTFHALYRLIGGRDDYVMMDPARTLALFQREVKRGDTHLAALQQQFAHADRVVVNGGATLLFRRPSTRELKFQLFAVELAAFLGKPVTYVNAMAVGSPKAQNTPPAAGSPKTQNTPLAEADGQLEDYIVQTLRKCEVIAMCDPLSRDIMQALGLEKATWYPDALFTWRTRYASLLDSDMLPRTPELLEPWPETDQVYHGRSFWSDPYICISSDACPPEANPQSWSGFYEKLITALTEQTGMQVIVVDPEGNEFLRPLCEQLEIPFVASKVNLFAGAGLLAGARAYVGGRYHPAIMASLGGAPCTILDSGEQMAGGLQYVLDYDEPTVYPIDQSDENISAIMEDVTGKLGAGDVLRKRLINLAHTNSYKVRYGLFSTLNNPA